MQHSYSLTLLKTIHTEAYRDTQASPYQDNSANLTLEYERYSSEVTQEASLCKCFIIISSEVKINSTGSRLFERSFDMQTGRVNADSVECGISAGKYEKIALQAGSSSPEPDKGMESCLLSCYMLRGDWKDS